MELKYVSLVLSLLFAVGSAKPNQVEWNNCDSSSPILVSNLTVLPYPISLEQGVILRINATINFKYTVSLKIEKKFLAWWPTIPCIRSVGSCDYNIGLQKFPTQTIEIPDISVPSFITDGKYRVRADVREDKTNHRLFCITASFTIDT